MIQITDATFPDFLKNHLAVLSFTSPWCAACKKVHAHTEVMEDTYPAITFGSLDISTSPETPARYQVFGIPTIIFFKDGTEVKRLSGTISEKEIVKELNLLT